MTHNSITKQEKLNKEYDTMGKILMQIILKYEENDPDWKINRVLNREDWKERLKFEVEVESKKIAWKGVHSYHMEPKRILEKLTAKNKELEVANSDYQKTTKEQGTEIDQLKKDLKEKGVLIEKQKEQIVTAKLDAETHYDFIGALERLNGKVRDELHEEIENKTELLETANEIIDNREVEKKTLKKQLEEKSELLDEAHEVIDNREKEIQELQNQIHLFNKPLPPLPSKKKQTSIGTKIKSKFHKFQNLAKRIKQDSRELIARIEAKTN